MCPARAKSHRARVAPYPTRLPIEDGHPLMPLQSKVSISDLLNAIAKLTILEVPKPMLNFETTEVLDPPILSPGPSEDQEPNVDLGPSPESLASGSLVLSGGPPENQESDAAARPAPESGTLILSAGLKKQEPDAARSAPEPLAIGGLIFSAGPPENQELNIAVRPAPVMSTSPSEIPIENSISPPQVLPAPAPLAEVQHNASWNPTPRLDMRKTKSKRQHNEHTADAADKTRLIAQDILTTRVAMQEKDNVIDLLKNEVSGR